MMVPNNPKQVKRAASLLLSGMCLVLTVGLAQAESLFRTGVSYQATQPYTPHSLFAVPRPASVGDLVTININQNTTTSVQNNMTISRSRNIDENSTSFFNDLMRRWFKIEKRVFPVVDGIQIDATAKSSKNYKFSDSVTCQVVQVLPNGHLVVQGKKTIFASQEQQDLYVTGIVNPYYLDAKNTIGSQQVANLQMNIAGHGVITRQQGDGILGKYYQFMN
jgi:flagellar L-ring protein FlgH